MSRIIIVSPTPDETLALRVLRTRQVMLRHAHLAERNGQPEVGDAYRHSLAILLRNLRATVTDGPPPQRSATVHRLDGR